MITRKGISEKLDRDEEREIRRVFAHIGAQGLGISMGVIFALALFVATNLLILRGGEHVGAHLGLLASYFPGYRVSFDGSLAGSFYAFVTGYAVGYTIGAIYNRIAEA